MAECEALPAAIAAWLAKADWSEADHPRGPDGRFIGVDAMIDLGRQAIEQVITGQTDVLGAMHRKGIGPIDFRWGSPKGGIQHILAQHSETEARKLPEVIARGKISYGAVRTGSRPRTYVTHDGYRAVLSPDYFGEPGHWIVSGFDETVKKNASGAPVDPHENRAGLRIASLSSLPTVGAEAGATLPQGGRMAKTFDAIRKDMTASSVHSARAIGVNESKDGEKAKTFPAVLADIKSTVTKRALQPNTDGATAKSPFVYDPNALGSLRPDQVPRFFGALTDSDKLPTQEVDLSDLHAMQDRVDPAKVNAIRESGAGGKPAVVVQHDGKRYIADGHHRLTADWLEGKKTALVRFKDLEPVSNAMKGASTSGESVVNRLGATYRDGERLPARVFPEPTNFKISKVDDTLGLVFGWAIISKLNGEDYYDLNVDFDGPHAGERVPEHIPESVMMKSACEFMQTDRVGNEMHAGPDKGTYVFAFPLTTEIAKAMGIQSEKTGLMVGFKPPADMLAKFKSGELRGFSIEGRRLQFTEHAA